jgi:arylsulfatase A-like enzyme
MCGNSRGFSPAEYFDRGGHDQMAFINAWGPLPTHSLTCLTKQYKYTYWWYGDDNMEPVEELFDIENDPLELTNVAASPDSTATLEEMRKRYDQELAKWKRQAVDYNDYQRYGVLFDRNVLLSEKNVGKPKESGARRLENQKRRRKEEQEQ